MQDTSYRLNSVECEELFERLSSRCDIWAPATMPRDERHSDQPVVGYRQVTSFGEIRWDQKTHFSPKEAVLPVRETLFRFVNGKEIEEQEPVRPCIVFLRPCDVHGIDRLDAIYLRNGKGEDYYYARRRRQLKFFVIECVEGFDSCFCVSMGTNRVDDYDAAVRVKDDGLSIRVKDESLLPCFEASPQGEPFELQFSDSNKITVETPDPDKIDESIIRHEMWDEYSHRCISCGRCNTCCVTCSCFSMQDVFHDPDCRMGERRRVWTGCQIYGFSTLAGGHSYRQDGASRMRYKVLHKVHDFMKRNGQQMCVGCGRCDDVCPEYISFSTCVNKLTALTSEKAEQ